MENKPVIAIYDVRGIQDYIFRTNKVKEIVLGQKKKANELNTLQLKYNYS